MSELQHLPHGHILHFLSPTNQRRVASYLALLQARQYAPDTLRAIAGTLKSFCLLLPEARRALIVDDFACTTPEDIDAYMQAASDQELAPATISNALGKLRSFFAFLLEEGELSRQPIRRHRHSVFVPQTLPRPMTEADVAAFFQVIDSLRDRVIFLLMLRCGLRVSEVARLPWSAVNWEHESLRIDDGKGHVDRVVYCSPDLTQTLRQWQRLEPPTTPYVFPSPYKPGCPISKRLIQHRITHYCQQAPLTRPYSAHCLRHTFATQLLNAGASLEVVKELMGHRTFDMTLRYAQLYESTKRQQYDQAMARVEPRQTLERS